MISDRSIRTFGDLMRKRAPSAWCNHCKRCGKYGRMNNWLYSTRASICEECATKAADELLPSVAAAERKARRLVKDYKEIDARFVATLTGASVDYAQKLIDQKSSSGAQP